MLTTLLGRWGLMGLCALVLASVAAQAPIGATFAAADVYRLPDNVVVPNDLYVIANEVVIEGEVRGHLAVISRRALVTGTVTGSTNVLAARIELQGARIGLVRTIGAALSDPQATGQGVAAAGGIVPVRLTAGALAGQQAEPPAQREASPWLRPTLLILIGFAALAAALLALAPQALLRPADTLSERPWRTLLVGLLVVQQFLLIPFGTIILALLIGYFWDWFPAMLLVIFVVAGFGLLWFLSPLVTGVWAGRWLNQALGREARSRWGLVLGIVLLALLGQIPTVGWIVYLASFFLAAGAIAEAGARSARRPLSPAEPAPVPTAPAPEAGGSPAG